LVPEDRETVVIGVAADVAGDPAVPEGTAMREVTADADLRAVAAMESAVWGGSGRRWWGWCRGGPRSG
jgi:hypothetical protein